MIIPSGTLRRLFRRLLKVAEPTPIAWEPSILGTHRRRRMGSLIVKSARRQRKTSDGLRVARSVQAAARRAKDARILLRINRPSIWQRTWLRPNLRRWECNLLANCYLRK